MTLRDNKLKKIAPAQPERWSNDMDEKIPCTIYIDEAGDLGANRGTRWFVLTAVIVDKKQEPSIRECLAGIKNKFNIQTLHWRQLRSFYHQAYAATEIASQTFTYVNVLFDTTQYDRAKMKSTDIAYNYICRMLIERVSWFLRDTNRTGPIMISSRGTSKDAELIDYIENRLLNYHDNSIAKGVIAGVTARTASTWDMLQLADACATTMFSCHELHWLGFITPCHATKLKDKLYSYNGTKTIKYGMKYFSDNMEPSKEYFTNMKICSKKRETPSATAT